MISLKNEWIRLDLDERARVIWLEDRKSGNGNIIAEPVPIFRAIVLRTPDAPDEGENKEDMAFAEEQELSVKGEGHTAEVLVTSLKTGMGEKKAVIHLRLSLEEDEIVFGGEIENNSDSCIDELFYPCVGSIKSLGGGAPDLLYPVQSGQRIVNICHALAKKDGREELHEITETYPGHLSMSWMALADGENCLYMACYDSLFHAMSLRARGYAGGVALEMDKMCFVKKGETWQIPGMALRLYRGSWRSGADEYAAWAGTWRKPVKQTEWMKRLNGYFLVINKQQYGEESWPYAALPQLYDFAQAHGYDCLGLFGWYRTGHDNNYPDLTVSSAMGGEEGLKEGIRSVQEKGGHVTLYYQGHLMDVNSPFYKKEGEKWEGKNIWGSPYYEFYPKFCYSDKLRFFSRKVFATVCPTVKVWHKMMSERADWIAGFGADGALYDQIGGMPPYPCFNEKHGHMNGKPSLSYTQGRLQLLGAIREHADTHAEFAFMSEHITDLYSQFLDCVHGIGTEPDPRYGMGERICGKEGISYIRNMPELFRYCFPDTMITARNPKPYMDARIVNYAFAYGFKYEMEIRYDTDKNFLCRDQAPEKREYAKKVAGLRRRYEAHLLYGTFRADEGIERANVCANIFLAADGSRMAALWNDSDKAVRLDIAFARGKASGWSTVDADGEGMPEELPADGIAVLILQE